MSFDPDSIGKEAEKEIKSHMDKQPYNCTCQDCGKDLNIEIDIDSDYDMTIVVPVCSCATKENRS